MEKILLAIQFWKGDQAQAMQVARLIADMQPVFSDRVEFLFVARFDCAQDVSAIEYVSKKFAVHHMISPRRAVGWPFGCNELWFALMDYVYTRGVANKMPQYKAILTFEADAFPLTPNWLRILEAGWDGAKVKVYGAMQISPGPHVNGNAMFSGDMKFLYEIARRIGGCRPTGGWDFILARKFKKFGWANCPAMRSWWNYTETMTSTTYEQLLREGVVFFHGCKDASLIPLVRKKFLTFNKLATVLS